MQMWLCSLCLGMQLLRSIILGIPMVLGAVIPAYGHGITARQISDKFAALIDSVAAPQQVHNLFTLCKLITLP